MHLASREGSSTVVRKDLTANHAPYIGYLHGPIRKPLNSYLKIRVPWFGGLRGNAHI